MMVLLHETDIGPCHSEYIDPKWLHKLSEEGELDVLASLPVGFPTRVRARVQHIQLKFEKV